MTKKIEKGGWKTVKRDCLYTDRFSDAIKIEKVRETRKRLGLFGRRSP